MRGPLLTQDEANLSRQLPQVKGFLQEVAATGLKQCSGLIHHVMAACKENLDAGFDFTDPVEYRLTAHIRHNQIQNHQIDKSAFFQKQLHSGLAAIGRHNGISQPLKHHFANIDNIIFVINQQNGFIADLDGFIG